MAEAEDTTDDMTVSYHSDAGEPVPSTPQRKSSGVASQPATGGQSNPPEAFDEAELMAMGSVLYEDALQEEAKQHAIHNGAASEDAELTSAQKVSRRRGRHKRMKSSSTLSQMAGVVKNNSKSGMIQTLASAFIDSPRSESAQSITPSGVLIQETDLEKYGIIQQPEEEAALASSGDEADSPPVSPDSKKRRNKGFNFSRARNSTELNSVIQEAAQSVGCANLDQMPGLLLSANDSDPTRNLGLRLYYASMYYMFFGFSLCCFALASVAANVAVFFIVRWLFLNQAYETDANNTTSMIVGASSAVGLDLCAGWAIWIVGVAQHRMGRALIIKYEEFEDLVKDYVCSEAFRDEADEIFHEHATDANKDAIDGAADVENYNSRDLILEPDAVRRATGELQAILCEERGLPELKGWNFFTKWDIIKQPPNERHLLLEEERERAENELSKRRMNLEEWMEFLTKQLLKFSKSDKTRKIIEQNAKRELEKFKPEDEEMAQRFGVEWMNDQDVELCPQCDQEFTMFFRRHHCRFCGSVVCNDCLHNDKVLNPITQTEELICYLCKEVPETAGEGGDVDEVQIGVFEDQNKQLADDLQDYEIDASQRTSDIPH